MGERMLGRTALVTGSTDGIGVGIARTLAAHGAQVVVSGRNVARGEEVVAAIVDKGGRATFVRVDLQEGAPAARELAVRSMCSSTTRRCSSRRDRPRTSTRR